ncbi:Uncharacterised protein [Escherichia coli]|uniref:Uncharacterized protein n=1 Tax=Escherichia coli TaxID=562 RepID=A0A2X3K534_ECOLX|nr:Uncharacterised protein [Escherichia coli]
MHDDVSCTMTQTLCPHLFPAGLCNDFVLFIDNITHSVLGQTTLFIIRKPSFSGALTAHFELCGKLRINRDLRNDTLIIECDYTKYVIIQHAITRRITAFRNTHRAGG